MVERFLLTVLVLAPAMAVEPAAAATPAKPAAPLWASYVKPEAVEAMKTFFSSPGARKLKDDRSILSLAQGKPVEGVATPPQLLPVFAAPVPPPASSTLATWKAHNLLMVGFWYRWKFGFSIYRALTKETGKWIDAAIKYFDLLANGYFAMYALLGLSSALQSLQTFSWTDATTYAAGWRASLELREARALLCWLLCQNALDLLSIEEHLGVRPPDSKLKAWYAQLTPWAMAWAFMHWEMVTDVTKYQTLADGAPLDAAKASALAALWFRKKFALGVRSIVFALVADGMPQQPWLASLVPWVGFSLSSDAMAISVHTALAEMPATAAKDAAERNAKDSKAAAQSLVERRPQ